MGSGGEAKESLEGRHRGPSPIEAEGELVEVGLEMVVADTVVRTARRRRSRPRRMRSPTTSPRTSGRRPQLIRAHRHQAPREPRSNLSLLRILRLTTGRSLTYGQPTSATRS